MLTIMTTLWSASGLNKLWPYLLVVLIVTAAFSLAYLEGRKAGTTSVATKQLKDSLNQMQQEAQVRAEVQSTSTIAARKQLRERWSAK